MVNLLFISDLPTTSSHRTTITHLNENFSLSTENRLRNLLQQEREKNEQLSKDYRQLQKQNVELVTELNNINKQNQQLVKENNKFRNSYSYISREHDYDR